MRCPVRIKAVLFPGMPAVPRTEECMARYSPLSDYALAMQCPVMTYTKGASSLRTCNEMPGADIHVWCY
eukprot:3005546-Rhodomonas_salina.2